MARPLRAGAARIEITPPVGVDLTGFIARTNPSIGVRDPLYARALVLNDGTRHVAVVVADIIGLPDKSVHDIRRRVTLATGIPGPSLMVAATHTHGGPATMFLQDCGTPDAAYIEELERRMAEAVVQAHAALRPVTLAAGQAANDRGVHNRRVPGGPIDRAVELLRFDDLTGKPVALVVNYACHPTTLNHTNCEISADYPGAVTQQLEEATGAITLFLTGAIGNVGPVARGETSLTEVADGIVTAALEALPTLTEMPGAGLDTEGELLHLPLQPLPQREEWLALRSQYQAALLAAGRSNDAAKAKIAHAMLRWAERMFEAAQAGQLSPTVDAEIHLLRVRDCAIVGVPGELFVELGMQIKREGALRRVLVVGFANGNIGYIPTRDAYAAGGYEITDAYRYYGYPAALAPEAGEQLVARAVQLTQRTKIL